MSDLQTFLDTAIGVATQAGALIRKAYDERAHAVEFKEQNAADLVTETDRAVEKLCFTALAAAFPTHAFIGEEATSDAVAAADAANAANPARCEFDERPTWIVDPVDGTMNFFHGFPYTAVSIGLCIGREPVVGVIYNPVLDQMYYAARGLGAFLRTPAATLSLPLNPSAVPQSLTTALIAAEYGASKDTDILNAKIATLQRIVTKPVAGRGIRSVGSAALSMCLVADGGIDAYYEAGVHAWDIAAGIIIVREAGGIAVNWNLPASASGNTLASAAKETIDVMARNVICVRGVKGAAAHAAGQPHPGEPLIAQLRSLIEPIHYPFD
eukprot:jgi/Hompol1/5271/HPOL_004293-RA